MYYSVIRTAGEIILLEDPDGDVQTFTKDFFDYEVQENDLVYLQNGIFHYAKEETERVKKENFSRLQNLFNK